MGQAARRTNAQPGSNGSTEEQWIDYESRATQQILRLLHAEPDLKEPQLIISKVAERIGTPSGVPVRRALWTLVNRRALRFTKDWRVELVRREP